MEIAMTDLERKQNLARAAKGDAAAFGALYGELADDLYRFALWSLKNREDAEDAVQEACLAAWKGLTSLRKPEAFRSWLMKILSNRCKDILRRRGSVQLLDIETAEALVPVVENFPETDEKDLLRCLSEEDRNIVLLSVYGGLTSKEIAGETGLKAATVRSRLSRSLAKVRRTIEEDA